MPKGKSKRALQLITSVFEPELRIDQSLLESLGGRLLALERFRPAILTVTKDADAIADLPLLKKKRKQDPCCDRTNENPTATVVSTALSADFSMLEVEVVASHPCGIQSIGGHIRVVTYQQVKPGVIRRTLEIFRRNGNPVVDGGEYRCPSNRPIRARLLQFPTAGLLGLRFLARIKVASCCNIAPQDTSVAWVNTSEKFII
jgi:hypothetical protein